MLHYTTGYYTEYYTIEYHYTTLYNYTEYYTTDIVFSIAHWNN